MNEEKGRPDDKKQVRKIIDDFFTALSKKDIKAMMMPYASDVVIFDVKPPFQTKGAIAWKHIWEACLPYFPEAFSVETRDMVITTGGNVAIAHYMFRLKGPEKDHDAMQTWMRATTGFKYQQGKWRIIHEHGSVPFHPETMQAIFTLEP
jgi:ketosteroid isomerase-like protein